MGALKKKSRGSKVLFWKVSVKASNSNTIEFPSSLPPPWDTHDNGQIMMDPKNKGIYLSNKKDIGLQSQNRARGMNFKTNAKINEKP